MGIKTDLFQFCGYCWLFWIFWDLESSTFTVSSFRIRNNSAGIPSPPLAWFVVVLPKAHLTSHSRMSGSRWVITPLWLSRSLRFFLYRSVLILIPKKGNAKECSNYCTIALISHASKVMLKILQARFQQYVNRELPDVQAGFKKGRGTRDQCQHLLDHRKSKRIPEKHLLLHHWIHESLWLCGWQ